ncbi:MAG: TIGR02679 family protein [Solirubrobacterales bacterium]|nr:TIGR02679 family protein [Solirubrobacterales bacterium]
MSAALPATEAQALRAYLGQPGFQRLLAASRAKVEQHGRVAGTVTLEDCTLEEIQSLAGLLGRRYRPPTPGGPAPVRLASVDAALRSSRFAVGLEEALELIGGPLANHRAARRAVRDGRAAVWTRAEAHAAAEDPAVAAWLEHARSRGAVARLAYEDDGTGLMLALDVAAQLPLTPPEAQAILAAGLRGDAHALDAGTAAGQLLVNLLAHRDGIPAPGEASERRALLERHGVLTDSISCAVVALNLPVAGGGLVAGMTRLAAGRHLALTLGNLTDEPLAFTPATVFVCENPSVVRKAERGLGAACPPLVCADGQFTTACLRLLEALRDHGCDIRVHGDFDWGGLNIVSRAMQTVGAEPWRYDVDSYRDAITARPTAGLASRRPRNLHGRLLPLAAAIAAAGHGVHEEAVLDLLIEDLREASRRR